MKPLEWRKKLSSLQSVCLFKNFEPITKPNSVGLVIGSKKIKPKELKMLFTAAVLGIIGVVIFAYYVISIFYGGKGAIYILFYDGLHLIQKRQSKLPSWWPRPMRKIFLAGPSTGNRPENRFSFGVGNYELSTWRGKLVYHILRYYDSFSDLLIIVPEFSDCQTPFPNLAEKYFGKTVIPPQAMVKSKVGWGVLMWERRWLKLANSIVCWCDFRGEQPGLGLNARPEIAEQLAVNYRKVILGISPESCEAMTRFWALAHEKKLAVHRTVEQLADDIIK